MTTPSLRVYPLLYLPRCPTWTGAISNPYMGHIWVTPVPKIGLWTFEPAFSPWVSFPLSPRSIFSTGQRFLLLNHVTSGSMSPRSFFPTGQRFLISNHVTSGSHEPTILFIHWSAVSHTGNDMTSFICSRPIRSQPLGQTSRMYYSRNIRICLHGALGRSANQLLQGCHPFSRILTSTRKQENG